MSDPCLSLWERCPKGGEGPLSHGCAVPAPPKGEPRGGVELLVHAAPHPSRLCPATLSQKRGKNIPRRFFKSSEGIAKLEYLVYAARSVPRRYFLAGVFMRMAPTIRMTTMSGSI